MHTHEPHLAMMSFSVYIFPFMGILFLVSPEWPAHDQSLSFIKSHKFERQAGQSPTEQLHRTLATFSTRAQQVSITDLLNNSQDYHQQRVSVRGEITQPELHLDETELYLDFVFRLTQGTQSIVVFGRHNRTLGAPPIVIDHSVEVTGIFWKEQERDGITVSNLLEALSVAPYPSSIPGST